ncbi:MAG: hypothetical protein ABIE43_05160 [Patescibacteria group bacterium]
MKKIIILSLLLVFITAGCSFPKIKSTDDIIGPEEAKAKAEEFINANLMQPGTKASIKDISEEGDLYKIVVDIGGQDVDSYLSKDGNKFFPQVFDIAEIEKQVEEGQEQSKTDSEQNLNISKSDKPKVELVITSYCPYGLQSAKGMVPTAKLLGDKIDFQFRYFNIPSHGEKEEIEGKLQICVRENESGKFLDYVNCFANLGDSEICLNQVNIDKGKINNCLDNEIDKYYSGTSEIGVNVGSSPTLLINGNAVESGRSSAAYLATICSAFNNPPEECNQELSSATPTPGFGSGSSDSGSEESCN